MSSLETRKIEPQSGTALQLGASGDTLTLPSGATLNIAGTISNSGTASGFGAVDWQTSDVKTSTFYSGDIACISSEGVRIDRQSSDFVRVLNDDSDKIIFKPVMEVTPIRSKISDSGSSSNELKIIEEFIEGVYIEKLNACDKIDGWKHWQTLYQIEVFDSNGDSQAWNIDFRDKKIRASKKNLGKIQ